jgi:lipoprotein-anchoring transpeptidase ErfK/SrfK
MSHASRPPGSRRGGPALALALLAGTVACVTAAPPAAAAGPVPASRPLVVLLEDHVARERPHARARRIESVRARRPLTGVRTVLPVLRRAVRGSWLLVRLPGRPNAHTGWIRATGTRGASTAWHIVVRLSTRRVAVYRDGHVLRRFRAVVGAPSTPTPRGRFFVEEALALSPVDAGNPFALATSARSEVLQEFEGGPGQIALHGTNGLSDALGTAASHGCIRLSTPAITWLARRIGAGVPIAVRR